MSAELRLVSYDSRVIACFFFPKQDLQEVMEYDNNLRASF